MAFKKQPGKIWRYSFEKERYEISEIYPHKSHFTKLKLSLNDVNSAKPIAELSIISYPNPFNPATTIGFSLAEESEVTLEIYNIKGQKNCRAYQRKLASRQTGNCSGTALMKTAYPLAADFISQRLTVGKKKLLQK